LLGAVAIAGLTTVQANAVDTSVTFTATGGGLAITAAPSATLTGGTTTPGGTVSGSLGLVTVTDSRGAAATVQWTAGVYSTTGFIATSNPSITNASVTYTPGSPTTTAPGTPTVTPGTAGSPGASSGAALTAYAYSNTTAGGNIVSWSPTLAVVIPSTAAAGAAYSGTVSHQVA
jgi:hypothetical protein